MKVFQGIVVTVRDKDGNQVLGLDSRYAPDIIDKHGKNGTFVSFFGDYSIEIMAYTDSQNRYARWKHQLNNWLMKRALEKRLRKTEKSGPSDTRITTLSHPTGADFQAPLTLSPLPNRKSQNTSDSIKQRRGFRDVDTSPDASGDTGPYLPDHPFGCMCDYCDDSRNQGLKNNFIP